MKSICKSGSLLCVLNTKMSPYYNTIYHLAHWKEKSITLLHSYWSSRFFSMDSSGFEWDFLMNNCSTCVSEVNKALKHSGSGKLYFLQSKLPPKNKPHNVRIHKWSDVGRRLEFFISRYTDKKRWQLKNSIRRKFMWLTSVGFVEIMEAGSQCRL